MLKETYWREYRVISLYAAGIVCLCDCCEAAPEKSKKSPLHFMCYKDRENIAEDMMQGCKEISDVICEIGTGNLMRLYKDYGISLAEHNDRLQKALRQIPLDIGKVKRYADILALITADITHNTLRKNEFYENLILEEPNV